MAVAIILRLLVVMGLWAACFPLITLGLDLAPHLAFAAMRAALAGLSLVLLGAAAARPIPQGHQSWRLIVIAGFGTTFLGFLGMFHAAEFISPGLATVIANAQPLIAAALAHAILRERLTALGKAGLVIGLAGISAVAWPGLAFGNTSDYARGVTFVALAAVGVAVGNIAIKRLTGRTDAIMAMGFQFLIGAIPLALLSAVTEDLSSVVWSGRFILVLFTLALFGTALVFWLWFGALERVALNQANAFTFLVPLLGLAIGAAFFGERLDWSQGIGVILVLGGIVFVQRGSKA